MIQLLAHTGRQFGLDAADQQGVGVASIMPQFFGDQAQPDVLVAVRAWTSALVAALDRQDTHVAVGDPPRPRSAGHADFRRDTDDYLSPALARHLAGLFPHADLRLVDNASHWPRWDQPAIVARLIK